MPNLNIYWNKPNFDGLKAIGDSYSAKEGYEDFAEYCLLREKGLKKPSFDALARFLEKVDNRPLERKRKVAEELAALAFFNPDVHQLLPHPLKSFVTKILEQWCNEQPSTPVPHRWLGCMSRNRDHFKSALEVDPNDEISLSQIAQAHLSDADFQMHHLCESLFLGSEDDAYCSIEEAAKHVMRLPSGELQRSLSKEISCSRALLDAWNTYRRGNKEIGFPEWCTRQGLDFNFGVVVYYGRE